MMMEDEDYNMPGNEDEEDEGYCYDVYKTKPPKMETMQGKEKNTERCVQQPLRTSLPIGSRQVHEPQSEESLRNRKVLPMPQKGLCLKSKAQKIYLADFVTQAMAMTSITRGDHGETLRNDPKTPASSPSSVGHLPLRQEAECVGGILAPKP